MPTAARSQNKDPYLTNKFGLVFESGPLKSTTVYGFQTISMPEQSIEQMEYSEGLFTYSRVYPGRSSFGTVTLGKGAIAGDSTLAKWIRRASEGWNYRSTVVIYQYSRRQVSGKTNYADATPDRKIRLVNAVPVRFKPGSDFDAMSAEISIQEIEIAFERFVIFDRVEGRSLSSGIRDFLICSITIDFTSLM
jgi:phage tail-like protein